MLNNPFCYTPRPEVVRAAERLCSMIDGDQRLHDTFQNGKMLGVLQIEGSDPLAHDGFLYAFSGRAGDVSIMDGFVPPIFDYDPKQIDAKSQEHSQELQKWLFSNYVVFNGYGQSRSVLDIFDDRGLVPPGGTGDCAGPKLLNYALTHHLKPMAIGEFWYGAPPRQEVRRHGAFYPSCTGKCGPLLGWMMQGLDVEPNPLESDQHWNISDPIIIHEDDSLVIVEKPSGMLAVPGRTEPGSVPRKSLQEWLAGYCHCPVFSCHRLDMDTSGLMVFAKTTSAQVNLQRQFEGREVSKAYVARLCPAIDGRELALKGKISLPLAPDWEDRPRQKVDTENGKPAVTEYEVIAENPDGTVEIRLVPYTGRTHQLRVHTAHVLGLGRPIVGDRLYGGTDASRLMLHASYLSFRHPSTGSRLTFNSEPGYGANNGR